MADVDVLTFGESMAAFRSAGPFALGGTFTAHLAGAESNVAIALSRLGHRVEWAGRVSGDDLGELLLRELRAEGVGVAHVARDAERPTGLMFVEARTADLVRVSYNRSGSAGSALAVDQLRAAVTAGSRLLHLTGITPALSATACEATLWAAQTAAAAGAAVSLDVNFRSRLWSRRQARQALAPLVEHARTVIASDDELDLLGDPEASEDATVATLLRRGVRAVVVKRGPAGASVHTAGRRADRAALDVTAVDTIGAGDAFTAGYLSGTLDGLQPAGCLDRAVLLGAFSVSTRGDWEGLPTRAELHLLHEHAPGSAVR